MFTKCINCCGSIIIYVLFACLLVENCVALKRTLRHYEVFHKDDVVHRIVKRGAKQSSNPYNTIKELEFKTLGKNFRVILHPHRDVLHSKFRAYAVDADGNETVVHLDHDNFYTGRVFGKLESSVRAHIEDGTLTMSIELPEETYHIEPSWRHLPTAKKHTMVAYKTSDVKLNQHDAQGIVPKTCGYIKEGRELESNDIDDNAEHLAREKRQADQYEYTPTKTRCPLLLVADYRFFQEMGGGNTKTTINYLISLIDRVHKIYNDTVWQDRSDQEGFKGMGFVIKKIVVHSEPTRLRGGEAHYNMIREKWDVRNLLESTSRMATRST
ncbi:ADAM 17-like protease isoform X2 [Drosophila albomicans]|uniref:ADAM 17-like protease isoform X2 n=1 Tax=Drosophila albomicans TaxID=7291 RepID=A0A6P8XVG0_DROAB|nr:ADAM 17-like protease isoform X2 [Drosophila albomicans]